MLVIKPDRFLKILEIYFMTFETEGANGATQFSVDY